MAEAFYEVCREVNTARRKNKTSLLDRVLGNKVCFDVEEKNCKKKELNCNPEKVLAKQVKSSFACPTVELVRIVDC